MGLMKRNISVKIYDQARSFREIGAGVAFALQCMALLDLSIVDAVNAVATPNGDDANNPNDYRRYHDGYHWDPEDPEGTDDKLLFLLHSGYKGFQGCHRAALLDELVKHIPAHAVEFGKRFESYVDTGSGQKVLLQFRDGTTAEADAVTRSLTAHSSPWNAQSRCEGSFKARNQHMHMGPSAHVLHFPVAGHTVLNFVTFVDEPADWPLGDPSGVGNMTAPATRQDMARAFKGWRPTVSNLVELLPDEMDQWAIFDTYDHPAPTFVQGRVCLAGDAAHASSPHDGAGAGIGVEDALAPRTLLEKATATLSQHPEADVASIIESSFSVYDKVRPPRSQWLVKSSRKACDIYEWNYPDTKTDWYKCLSEITAGSHKLWYFDIQGMLRELNEGYQDLFPAGYVAIGSAKLSIGLENGNVQAAH
ncbi:Uu.00g030900.m01.CDS01 [Anthostomella pinea]|uniref:Uu.00g030900.m01.CDS01 n=1 Tax=Anthostomella pinea TaxID=933095 RepID=A0AAI8YD13_9PEZI|nr:Uu.00g030900.m01.CDS01 [Anthostomella pinea]